MRPHDFFLPSILFYSAIYSSCRGGPRPTPRFGNEVSPPSHLLTGRADKRKRPIVHRNQRDEAII